MIMLFHWSSGWKIGIIWENVKSENWCRLTQCHRCHCVFVTKPLGFRLDSHPSIKMRPTASGKSWEDAVFWQRRHEKLIIFWNKDPRMRNANSAQLHALSAGLPRRVLLMCAVGANSAPVTWSASAQGAAAVSQRKKMPHARQAHL